jgi:hypothetical protein
MELVTFCTKTLLRCLNSTYLNALLFTVSHVTRNPPISMRRLFRIVTNWFPVAKASCCRDGYRVKWDTCSMINQDIKYIILLRSTALGPIYDQDIKYSTV